ncbi:MAG: DUF1080 domain-containing protein, partial [Planctomycetaceae bacterium]|nr:DUF1080 domain-containing protein [Planctomycetaceae bacterium]
MKTFFTSLLTLFFVCSLIFATNLFGVAKADEDEFVSIFNGTDLTGWEGIPGGWDVVDGCIVGESTPEKPCQRSHYLYWTEKEPDNFHLKLTFRLQGNGNSGIQFRSEKRPNWDTYG